MEHVNTWARAEEIFAEALAYNGHDRETLVRQRCGGDELLVEEVMRLLDAERRMGGFLDTSLLDFRGERFGAYRALAEVGRGGMSVVYEGERVDGGFDKKVAIKVVLTQVGAAPETKILASLEHPNIARLLDAGMSAVGFRYLVMEFVEGTPCTEYAGARSETEKLKLFLQVCAGVQAAHQSLVVHRDLKPDNILVTAEGRVKLLDFGIAKMLAPEGSQTVGPRAYTVEYASPEQILGKPASTANDVYSLGVVLYEWLSGEVPRKLDGLPLDEVVRRVRDETAPELRLGGELGMILRKAMEGDPAHRYESVGAMARDIERYLSGEPVEALPASFAYRARKFVVRHRYGVAAALAAVAALAGTAGYAARQAQLADTRFEQVRSLSRAVMFELHDSVEPLAGSQRARQLIANRSLQYLDTLAADATASDGVLLDAARGYLRIAELQAKEGNSDAALRLKGRAAELARRVLARNAGSAEAQAIAASATR